MELWGVSSWVLIELGIVGPCWKALPPKIKMFFKLLENFHVWINSQLSLVSTTKFKSWKFLLLNSQNSIPSWAGLFFPVQWLNMSAIELNFQPPVQQCWTYKSSKSISNTERMNSFNRNVFPPSVAARNQKYLASAKLVRPIKPVTCTSFQHMRSVWCEENDKTIKIFRALCLY